MRPADERRGWTARGCLGVLCLSYPWLDQAHPDRDGEILARVVPVLQHMLAFCGGEQFTVGVLWDYASLPQPNRTHAELTGEVKILRSHKDHLDKELEMLASSGGISSASSGGNVDPKVMMETNRALKQLKAGKDTTVTF